MAAYGGVRYYPLHVGHPVDDVVGDATVAYDSLWKPYIDGSLALGRALYQTIAQGTAEQAADTLGLNVGVGLTFDVFTHWVIEPSFTYEKYQSRGPATTLGLAGTNLFIMLGTGYLL